VQRNVFEQLLHGGCVVDVRVVDLVTLALRDRASRSGRG
jgi:hypothetical protein